MNAELNPQRLHIKVASIGFAILIGVLLFSRLYLGNLSVLLISMFLLAMAASLTAFTIAHYTENLQIAGVIMLTGLCVALSVGMYHGGGVQQPIAAVGPALPMFATVLLGWRWGWASLIYLVVLYGSFAVMELAGHPFPVNSLNPGNEDMMRTVYLVITASIVTLIASLIQTQSDQRADKLTEIAHEDFLTRTLNRRGFDIALRREFLRAKRNDKPLSLLLLDVDHFKQYNDAYGHARGDDCLVAITDAISGCLRRPGDSLSRIGGDEFAAILPNTDIRGAFGVAEQICGKVNKLGLASPSKQVTVTIGISEMRGESQVSDYQLVQEADRALYKAKQAGRNQVKIAVKDNVVNIASVN